MKVLMATDGSQNALQALTGACRILSSEDREIDLLCVAPAVNAKHHSHRVKLCRRAKRILEASQAALRVEGVPVKPMVQTGSASRVLIAASQDYDLTVVGAQSRKSRSSAGLGPVTSRVAEHANSSVLISRGVPSDPGLKILAPVDGSEASLIALDRLGALVDLLQSDVTLVHVVETPWLYGESGQEGCGYAEDEEQMDSQVELEREMQRESDRILDIARERLPIRTAVNTLIYRGLPAGEILAEAETGAYDLVVMNASGATDLKHQMLGSVSSQVAWHAPCSVLLVRTTG